MERVILVSAIWDSGLDEDLGFTVDSIHEPHLETNDVRGRWRVVLTPKAGRIYFLSRIAALIDSLNIEVAVFTDINNPGCIVIN